MAQQWQIAQLNIATAIYVEADDRMTGFYSRLDEINTLAEASEGFVWRLQSDSGNATDIVVDNEKGPPLEALRSFERLSITRF